MFKDLHYYIIGNICNKAEEYLQLHGGKRSLYLTDNITHCIIDDLSEPKNVEDYDAAMELYQKPVISSRWITESVNCEKLLPYSIFIFDQKKLIFRDMVIYVLNVCKEDRTLLWHLITCHGGTYANKPCSDVTHIITTIYNEKLCEAASTDCIFVTTPDWITDSISNLTVHNVADYHPSLLLSTTEISHNNNKPEILIDDLDQSDDDDINKDSLNINQLIDSKGKSINRLQVSALRIKEDFISSVDDADINAEDELILSDIIAEEEEPQQSIKVKVKHSPNAYTVHNVPKVLLQEDTLKKKIPKVSVKIPPRPRIVFTGSKPPDASKPFRFSKKQETRLKKNSMPVSIHTRPVDFISNDTNENPLTNKQEAPFKVCTKLAVDSKVDKVARIKKSFESKVDIDENNLGSKILQGSQSSDNDVIISSIDSNQGKLPIHLQLKRPPLNSTLIGAETTQVNFYTKTLTSTQLSLQNKPQFIISSNNQQKLQPTSINQLQNTNIYNSNVQNASNNILQMNCMNSNNNLHGSTNNIQQSSSQNTPLLSTTNQNIVMQGSNLSVGNSVSSVQSIEQKTISKLLDYSENVPEEACLLGCVFYITDYQKQLPSSEIDIWKAVICQYGGQVDDSYSNRITHVLCEHQKSDVFNLALRDGKRLVTAFWLNDCILAKKVSPPTSILHLPFIFGTIKICNEQMICVSNFEGEERNKIKMMIKVLGARYTGCFSRSNNILVTKIPTGNKYIKACEWKIPVVNVLWLHDLLVGDLTAFKLPVATKYTQFNDVQMEPSLENSKLGFLLEGWKIPMKISKDAWRKFQSNLHSNNELNKNPFYVTSSLKRPCDSNGDIIQEEKRPRLEYISKHRILITGIPKINADFLAQEVERLGGQVVTSGHDCTHLVAPAILRTVKFFSAISVAKFVVKPDWVDQSSLVHHFLDEKPFFLKDNEMERVLNIKLCDILHKAEKKKLFQGLRFYLSPSIPPSKSQLTEIIENAGGQIIRQMPSPHLIKKSLNAKGEPQLLMLVSDEDRYLCQHIISKLDLPIPAMHSAEFIFTGLLKQEINFKDHAIY